jgi:hypothetical protein
MSEYWVPPGYVHVTELIDEHGVNKVRSDLFAGRLQAFKWDGTAAKLDEIESRVWCADGAGRWLIGGWLAHYSEDCPPCMILVKVEDEPLTDGVYRSPFMLMMQKAVQHFEISEQRWPKKTELMAFFCAQKLPDGTPVTPTLAGYLATFCRPTAAMSGGNK